METQQAGLRGEPRHLIMRSLLHVLVQHGGGFLGAVPDADDKLMAALPDTGSGCIFPDEENFR